MENVIVNNFKFRNIGKVKRNRVIEGQTGTELGFDDGARIWVLAASDANPRWRDMGDSFMNELRRLVRANADEDRQKQFLAEWYARLFIVRWEVFDEQGRPVTLSQEAAYAYLMQSDDAISAIRDTINDLKRFRQATVESTVDAVGNLHAGTASTP